jgi:multiple sugar transport system ATP-binding protein
MADIELKNVYKKYPNGTVALNGVSFTVKDNEPVVLAGPPGSGKSTVLRIIAGLEEQDCGEIFFSGGLMQGGAKDRDVAMMFENFGLFLNKTVFDNLAYGLRLRKLPALDIENRVKAAAGELQLTDYLYKKAKILGGIMRKKVELGRALVRNPKIFLLDEPLKGLSGKDRTEMRGEILRIVKKLAVPFIYATIDSADAMTFGAKAVVLRDGEVMSIGAPQRLYDAPENLFTAAFFGEPGLNLFKAGLLKEDGKMYVKIGGASVSIPHARARRLFDEAYIGKTVILGVRPEDVHDEEVFIAASPGTLLKATVEFVERFGSDTVLYVNIDGKENPAAVRVDARNNAREGDEITVALDANRIHFFDPESGDSITGVPKKNRIFASLSKDGDGKTALKFGDNVLSPPDGFLPDITDTSVSGVQEEITETDVVLEFEPSSLTEKTAFDASTLERLEKGLPPQEGDFFELNAKVEFTEKYPGFLAAYTVVSGKRGLIVTLLPQDSALCGGMNVTLVGDYERLNITDFKTGERIDRKNR